MKRITIQKGDVIEDKFEVLDLVAETPFNHVYKARDRGNDSLVAIKVFRHQAAAELLQKEVKDSGGSDWKAVFETIRQGRPEVQNDDDLLVSKVDKVGRKSLEREQQALRRLHHAGIAKQNTVLENGIAIRREDRSVATHPGPMSITSWLEGVPLDRELQVMALRNVAFGMTIIRAIADGLFDILAAVHGAGVVNGDLKVGNLLLSVSPAGVRVSLVDFGAAVIEQVDDSNTTRFMIRSEDGELRELIMVTPSMLPPEGRLGKPVRGHAWDIWMACRSILEVIVAPAVRGPKELRDLATKLGEDPNLVAEIVGALKRSPAHGSWNAADWRDVARLLRGLARGLATHANERPSAREMLIELSNTAPSVPPVPPAAETRSSTWGRALIATLVVAGGIGAAFAGSAPHVVGPAALVPQAPTTTLQAATALRPGAEVMLKSMSGLVAKAHAPRPVRPMQPLQPPPSAPTVAECEVVGPIVHEHFASNRRQTHGAMTCVAVPGRAQLSVELAAEPRWPSRGLTSEDLSIDVPCGAEVVRKATDGSRLTLDLRVPSECSALVARVEVASLAKANALFPGGSLKILSGRLTTDTKE